MKGKYFYLIPTLLAITFALLAYVPAESVSNTAKLWIVAVVGIVFGLSLYLWVVTSDVPRKIGELEIKEIELTHKEDEIKYLESIVERIPVDVRYREFNREVCIDPADGSSDQTWTVIVENVSKTQNLTRLDIPSKRFDVYDQLEANRTSLKAADPSLSVEKIEELAFRKVEQVVEAIIGERALEKSLLEGLISDYTIHRRRFSKSGAYYDELASDGEVAEVSYTIPLEGLDTVGPGQTKRVILRTKNTCAYRNALRGEVISARVNKLYDETTMAVTCKEGYFVQRDPSHDAPTGLKVIDIATKRHDDTELGRVSNVYIDQDRRRLVWKILNPKIGYVYVMRFKLSKT